MTPRTDTTTALRDARCAVTQPRPGRRGVTERVIAWAVLHTARGQRVNQLRLMRQIPGGDDAA